MSKEIGDFFDEIWKREGREEQSKLLLRVEDWSRRDF